MLATIVAAPATAQIVVVDDMKQEIRLAAPAKRIISLAPHITELLFAAGAGSRVVGTVLSSDFPPEAQRITSVGAYDHPDLETLLRLKPDLVVAWDSGTPPRVREVLRKFRVPVFMSQPHRMEDVPKTIEKLGMLAGTTAQSEQAARRFRERLDGLKAAYSSKATLSAFYEVWNRPLMSVGGQHIITDVLRLCGASNIFQELTILAPPVNIEAVIAADPQVIIASGMAEERPEWLDEWRKWPRLYAVRHGNLYFVPPDIIQRHTPRILDGAEMICRQVDEARQKAAGKSATDAEP